MPVAASPSPREFDLRPADNARLANLCGPLDENLRLLESRLDVQIRRRGDSFRVTGVHAESAEDTLRELFDLTKSLPPTLKYEAGTIVADGSFVIVHGRFSGFGAPANWIAADILRIEDGLLVEHWDVIQDEATEEQSKSGAPMFGKTFPKHK